ncbi:MAG: ThuA domain-containing protein [Luteolibacter sp.]
MKALIPSILVAGVALVVVAQKPKTAQAPAGAAEKIEAALPSEAFVKPEKPRKLLVFARTNGFKHKSIPTGKLAFEALGKSTGAFETVVSDDLSNFEKENISQFDAICFLNTTGSPFGPSRGEKKKLSKEELKDLKTEELTLRESLMSFIENGGGFVGIHSATDTFYDWPEYGDMIGAYFDGHPWGAGQQVSIKVEPGKEQHPLAKMFGGENISFKEEIYQFKEPYDSSNLNMLLRLDTEKSDMTGLKGLKRKDKDFGVSWVRNHGKGRVFYSSIGHNHDMFWNEKILSHYLAGIQWALGDLKVTLDEAD